MTIIHNCVLRGINAIYLQADGVATRGTAKDKLDFANFAYQWGTMIDEHHQTEEEHVFPDINELSGVPGLMDANIQEHAIFHEGMKNFMSYLDRVKQGEEELSGEKLKGLIDDFVPTLRAHLDNEIETLVALDEYKVDWKTWFDKRSGEIAKASFSSSVFRVSYPPMRITETC